MVELGFSYLFPQNLSFKPILVSYTLTSRNSEMNSSQLCSPWENTFNCFYFPQAF